jgi:hypothetical protein
MSIHAEGLGGEVVAFDAKIEQPLIDGHMIHAFSSGSGLRVIRIETNDGELVGYGEAPQVEDAVAHAALDYQLGHEDYSRQYGDEDARYIHYLTGTHELSSPLDAHLRWGYTFDAKNKDGKVEVTLSGTEHTPDVPEGVHDTVRMTGKPATWEERGVIYEITLGGRFSNGKPCTSMRPIHTPEGVNAWMFRYTRLGIADTFESAVADAFEAPQVEIM